MTTSTQRKLKHALVYALLIVIVFLINLPTISMFGTALKSKSEALSSTTLFPAKPHFENILFVFKHTDFGRNIWNSFYISTLVTLFCLIFASMSGYALSRFRGRFFSFYQILLLMLQMFPLVLLLIPLFIIYKKLNFINTPFSLLFSYTTLNLPFSIWMLRGFFDTIPYSLEESVMIDGCSQFKSFYIIVLPLSAPGLSTVGIFTFINCWNEYMLASVFLRNDEIKTITVGLQKFVEQFTIDWSALMSASAVATIPTIFILLVAQKYLVQGLTAGAVKG